MAKREVPLLSIVGETPVDVEFDKNTLILTFDDGRKVIFERNGRPARAVIKQHSEAWDLLEEFTIENADLKDFKNQVPPVLDYAWPEKDRPAEYTWTQLVLANARGQFYFLWYNSDDGTEGKIWVIETEPSPKKEEAPSQ